MRRSFLLMLFAVFVFAGMMIGCDMDNFAPEPEFIQRHPIPLPDSRFNGEFHNFGIGNRHSVYTFDGTSKARRAVNNWYTIIDYSFFTLEIEVDLVNGRFRSRPWSDNASVGFWLESAWRYYRFNSNGQELNIWVIGDTWGTYTKR